MRQIGYFSTATETQDARSVHNILVGARKHNLRASITGLLVAGGGRYLQVIEGPGASVEALYARIQTDRRHLAVATFLRRDIDLRNFGSWSMAFRRPTEGAEVNSFVHVLERLMANTADTELKRQIRYFARATMMGQAA